MNATQLPTGRWYSFSNEAVLANQKLLGQIYQNELAIALQQLGYPLQRRSQGQFDLAGYSSDVLQAFSSRRQRRPEATTSLPCAVTYKVATAKMNHSRESATTERISER
jgi:conjugative relaxase-like TrwC/TraI family protein